VDPDLVVRDENGETYTVRYEAVNAMLLNEFQKEHRAFQKEHRKVQKLEATVAQQQKAVEVLTGELKQQAAEIPKVSAQLETRKPGMPMVVNP
jgi:hypothetical protein